MQIKRNLFSAAPKLFAAVITGTALIATLSFTTGCETDLDVYDGTDVGDAMAAGRIDGEDEQALTRQCAPAQTVKGVDVSYYQGAIDWSRVKASGVDYAFIRVADGSTFNDPRFQENWRNAKAAGVKRGAYQFFRSNKDAVEQADLLLEQMGALESGDLPPVIDVESTDGQSAATIQAKVQRWLDRVEEVLGVKPIIYTGPYFWRDQVKGGAAFAGYPLWVAHYGTTCPLVPEPWANYTFHQYTDAGRTDGISGNVDTNTFAGSLADLEALSFHAPTTEPTPEPTPTEPTPTEPPVTGCQPVPADGRIIDEDDACFTPGGPTEYLRAVSGEGYDGSLVWTHATAASTRENFGQWNVKIAQAGRYKIQAYTDISVATSKLARYRVEHDGVVDTKQVDQHSVDGWRDIGIFTLTTNGAVIVLNDNTGEALSGQKKIVFDAIRVMPTTETPPAPPPAPTCTRVKVVNASAGLNIRSSASSSSSSLGELANGSVVDRLSSTQGQSINGNRTWHRIQKSNGTRGYISAYYTTCVN